MFYIRKKGKREGCKVREKEEREGVKELRGTSIGRKQRRRKRYAKL